MPIPTYEKMLHPLLCLAMNGEITRREAVPAMEEHFSLSAEERQLKNQGGQTKVANRCGWAMTFLSKGGLITKISRGTYRITELGRNFLRDHPNGISVRDLEAIEGWEEAWRTTNENPHEIETSRSPLHSTPTEIVDAAVGTLHTELKRQLLNTILEKSPTFFEQLVLDVLIAMGYGGSRAEAAEHLGRSGDEGLDGRINQDPLGLDQILVQAKRYAPENVIDRKTIQAFVGSMTGQGVTKGIFITTSSFNSNAREFVQRGSHTKIVLIDGSQLLDLMLHHRIGVRVERRIELLDLDHNYFSDDEL